MVESCKATAKPNLIAIRSPSCMFSNNATLEELKRITIFDMDDVSHASVVHDRVSLSPIERAARHPALSTDRPVSHPVSRDHSAVDRNAGTLTGRTQFPLDVSKPIHRRAALNVRSLPSGGVKPAPSSSTRANTRNEFNAPLRGCLFPLRASTFSSIPTTSTRNNTGHSRIIGNAAGLIIDLYFPP